MPHNKITVDVHGSCVSRNIFNAEPEFLEVKNNFSRNNIVSCMMPPVDISVNQEELLFSSDYSYRCIKYALDKSTLPLLLQSTSDFLVIDFYDFCQHVAAYENTTFSTYDYSVLLAPSFKPYLERIKPINFLELPNYMWYGYVDLYFKKMKGKFKENILLVQLSCCNKYLSKSKAILPTPQRLLRYGNAKYNEALRALEDYVIARYDPYVIDVTKYFIADEAYDADVTPVHFAKNYQAAAWNIVKYIVQNTPEQKYYDTLPASIAADLLRMPISTEDFYKLWQDTSKPFSACGFLDEVCKKFPDEELIQNRAWLGQLYGHYQDSPLGAAPELEIQKIDNFMQAVPAWPEDNNFSKRFIKLLVQKYDAIKSSEP